VGVVLAEAMTGEGGLGPSGWAAVLAYALTGWLCLRAFMVEKAGPPRPYAKAVAALWRVVRKHWPDPPAPARRAGLWVGVALLLVVLGINRLLDIETLLLDWWREDAMAQGSYENRRASQGGFIGVVALIGVASAVGLLRIARGQLRDLRLLLSGTIFLLAFVVIRAVSLHAIDAVMRIEVAGVSVAVAAELLGLGVVALAAVFRLRKDGAPVLFGWRTKAKGKKGGPPKGGPPPRAPARTGPPPKDAPITITQLN